MKIQAVIFNKQVWTEKEAKKWLTKHSFVPIKPVHITNGFLRYRLLDPNQFSRFVTRKLHNHIDLILGY